MNKTSSKIILSSMIIGVLDAIFKGIAIKQLPEEGAVFQFPIGFALHKNPGIAFDIPLSYSLIFIFTIIIVFLLGHHAYTSWNKHKLSSAFSIMIIVGAIGNLLDRVVNGFTTDYIILINRSAINLSDILIILGTILLLSYSEDKESR